MMRASSGGRSKALFKAAISDGAAAHATRMQAARKRVRREIRDAVERKGCMGL